MLKPKRQETDWKHVAKIVQQAKQAQEKLIRDGMKMKDRVQKSSDPELLQVFKDSLNDLQKNERDLDHISLWKDILGQLYDWLFHFLCCLACA